MLVNGPDCQIGDGDLLWIDPMDLSADEAPAMEDPGRTGPR